MASHQYRFITYWSVEGTVEEVFRLIDDPLEFPRWWPAVWLKVEKLPDTSSPGVGKLYRVLSKGWLPYLLEWSGRTVEKEFPHRIVLHAHGDFVGEGAWTFTQRGSQVDVKYDWSIEANKPLLRYLSFLLKPLFAANHNWAMARGEESLQLELIRRGTTDAAELARLPMPPAATFWSRRRRERWGIVTEC